MRCGGQQQPSRGRAKGALGWHESRTRSPEASRHDGHRRDSRHPLAAGNRHEDDARRAAAYPARRRDRVPADQRDPRARDLGARGSGDYWHAAATRCSDCTRISRSISGPVTLTRWPTWSARCEAFPASLNMTGAELRFMNPDFQLRDFGASAPSVSFSKKPRSARCRHPVIETGLATPGCVASDDFIASPDAAAAGAVGAGAGAGFIDALPASLVITSRVAAGVAA